MGTARTSAAQADPGTEGHRRQRRSGCSDRAPGRVRAGDGVFEGGPALLLAADDVLEAADGLLLGGTSRVVSTGSPAPAATDGITGRWPTRSRPRTHPACPVIP
ncbi:hypothetical protein [Streptomyces sp. NPDC101132]|uniref:hypothetical protein n=1 Tax=Streptomyces sp. NPDC101132 TaxID=3366110 RepID=UPI0038134033